MSTLGKRLEKLAKALAIEDQELARIGEVGKHTFSKYKNDQAFPRVDTFAKWVTKLNVNAHWLLLGEGPMLQGEAVYPGRRRRHDTSGDPIADRAERIAALMVTHGASPEKVQEAILAVVGAIEFQAREKSNLYTVNENENEYTADK